MKSTKKNPNFAIVRIPESANVIHFYQLLLENGFNEVSFVNELRENAFPLSLTCTSAENSGALSTRSPLFASAVTSPVSFDGVKTEPDTMLIASIGADCNNNNNKRSDGHPDLSSSSTEGKKRKSYAGNANLSTNKVEFSNDSPNGGATCDGNETLVAAGSSQSPSVDEDGNVYATCLMCHNRIMCTRLSNLMNHVRRHAAMKQYQCSRCTYSHNEQAKVRLHMTHNHSEADGQPLDRLCFEMQLQWSLLMEKCFPDHAKRSKEAEFWKAQPSSAATALITQAAMAVLNETNALYSKENVT